MIRLLILFLTLLFLPTPASSEDTKQEDSRGGQIRRIIEKERTKATEQEQELKSLKKKEGSLSSRINSLQGKVNDLTRQMKAQEKILIEVSDAQKRTKAEHVVLVAEKERLTRELSGLLKTIWPVHVQNNQAKFRGIASWDEFDRRFTWLSGIYGVTRTKFGEVRENADKLERNLQQQAILETEAKDQLITINKTKDRLLGNRLSLRKQLVAVKTKKRDIESELQDILSTIKDLKYQLDIQKSKRIDHHKHLLPWPAKGTVVSGFSPRAKPPRRGIGFSLEEGAPVRSVFWGKVVHNDTLRGFGQVVIVYHGYDYYSLYAYLSETNVRSGQEVEKDEVIGTAGYYPKTKGPGLYFELRFHQKPINPKHWLISLK